MFIVAKEDQLVKTPASEKEDVAVKLLANGSIFESCGELYKKIHHNECRAYVQRMRGRHVIIEKDDRKEEFDAPGGFVNISSESLVRPVQGEEAKTMATATKKRGGKQASMPIKQCKPTTKRGKIVTELYDEIEGKGRYKVESLCVKLGINRSLFLTHCFEINRDHGMGYTLDGEFIEVEFLADPFAEVVVDDCEDLI